MLTQNQNHTPHFYTDTLSNGLQILHLPSTGQVAYAGLLIGTGSRDEAPHQHGISHLIEHMLFKGTTQRNAFHLAHRIESVGGEINAYTAKEETVLHAAFMPQYLERVTELLADIIQHATFPQHELQREKEVICEEIASYHDSPAELIYDEFEELIFQGHPLAHNILGTPNQLKRITREEIIHYIQHHYTPTRMVFCTAGNIPFSRVLTLANKYLASLQPAFTPSPRIPLQAVTLPAPYCKRQTKPTSQAHCLLGTTTLPLTHPHLPALALITNLLGGDASIAWLNRELREKKALVYTVDATHTAYTDTGLFTIYFATEKKNLNQALRIIHKQLHMLTQKPLGSQQLRLAKRQFIGQLGLAADNIEANMLAGARFLLEGLPLQSFEESRQEIQSISAELISTLAQQFLTPQQMYTLVYSA